MDSNNISKILHKLSGLSVSIWERLSEDEKKAFGNDPLSFDKSVKPFLFKELAARQIQECFPSIYKRAYYRTLFETLDETSKDTLVSIYSTFPDRLCRVLRRGKPLEEITSEKVKALHSRIEVSYDTDLFRRILSGNALTADLVLSMVETSFHWVSSLVTPCWDTDLATDLETLRSRASDTPLPVFGAECIERVHAWIGQCEADMDHFVASVKSGKPIPEGPPPNVHKCVEIPHGVAAVSKK